MVEYFIRLLDYNQLIYLCFIFIKGIVCLIVLLVSRIKNETLEYSCDFDSVSTACSPSDDTSGNLILLTDKIIIDPYYYRITDFTSICNGNLTKI